jgi:inorganic pyrophosphatase
VAALMSSASRGDGDPLDICVVSERPISRGEVVLNAKVIGGLAMVDGGEADDKIVAVLFNDTIWAEVDDIGGLPPVLVERLRHYFSTYKLVPGRPATTSIEGTYDRRHAWAVVTAAIADYDEKYG